MGLLFWKSHNITTRLMEHQVLKTRPKIFRFPAAFFIRNLDLWVLGIPPLPSNHWCGKLKCQAMWLSSAYPAPKMLFAFFAAWTIWGRKVRRCYQEAACLKNVFEYISWKYDPTILTRLADRHVLYCCGFKIAVPSDSKKHKQDITKKHLLIILKYILGWFGFEPYKLTHVFFLSSFTLLPFYPCFISVTPQDPLVERPAASLPEVGSPFASTHSGDNGANEKYVHLFPYNFTTAKIGGWITFRGWQICTQTNHTIGYGQVS